MSPLIAGSEPLQVVRALAALPGAGAWDAAPTEMFAVMADSVALYFSYTRGGAAGAFDFQIQVSPYSVAADVPAGIAEWYNMSVLNPGTLAAGTDIQGRFQAQYITYQAVGALQEAPIYTVALAEGIQRTRVRARESGNVGAPGTLGIIALFAERTRVIA
jgi:hypothetical protein